MQYEAHNTTSDVSGSPYPKKNQKRNWIQLDLQS